MLRYLILLIGIFHPATATLAEGDVVQNAIRSWTRQQKALVSGRFSFVCKGQRLVEDTATGREVSRWIDSGSYSLEIAIDGEYGRSRIQSGSPALTRAGTLQKQTTLAVFDGLEHSRVLRTNESWKTCVGTIHHPLKGNSEFSNVTYRPILLAFRMLTTQPGINDLKSDLIVKPDEETRDSEYTVLKTKSGNSEFWIDPSQDSVIKKWKSFSVGEERAVTDIRYRKVSDLWVPESWVTKTARTRKEVKLKSLSINTKLPSDLFRIEFREGTLVVDNTKAPQRQWLVKAGSIPKRLDTNEFFKLRSVSDTK